jgi:hypothetical protein
MTQKMLLQISALVPEVGWTCKVARDKARDVDLTLKVTLQILGIESARTPLTTQEFKSQLNPLAPNRKEMPS